MSQTEPSETSSPLIPRRKRRALRVWKFVLGVIMTLVIGYGLLVAVLGAQYHAAVKALKAHGQPVSSAELTCPKVPDDQNAAVVFSRAFKLIEYRNNNKRNKLAVDLLRTFVSQQSVGSHTSRFPPVSLTDAKAAAKQLAGVVPLTQEALSRPRCQFSTNWTMNVSKGYQHLGNLRTLVRVITAEAMIDAQEGRMEVAYPKDQHGIQNSESDGE